LPRIGIYIHHIIAPPFITAEDFNHIYIYCPNIRRFTLARCAYINPPKFNSLITSSSSSLENLCLCYGSDGEAYFCQAPHTPQPTTPTSQSTKKQELYAETIESSAACFASAHYARQLIYIDLDGSPINGDTLKTLCLQCPQLKTLSLARCTALTSEDLVWLKKLKELECLIIPDTMGPEFVISMIATSCPNIRLFMTDQKLNLMPQYTKAKKALAKKCCCSIQ